MICRCKQVKSFFLSLVLVVGVVSSEAFSLNATTALTKLLEGNERYVTGHLSHPDQTIDRRRDIAHAQHPFATVLGCADSRVPPEILFDQGLGDLFTVREAGNVIDDIVLGNIEYGVEHLHTPLVIVLGHTHCGAAEAAALGHAEGHIAAITKELEKAVALARKEKGDLVENIVRQNVKLIVEKLRVENPILKQKVDKGQVLIVGAIYDIERGRVNVITPDENGQTIGKSPSSKPSSERRGKRN